MISNIDMDESHSILRSSHAQQHRDALFPASQPLASELVIEAALSILALEAAAQRTTKVYANGEPYQQKKNATFETFHF